MALDEIVQTCPVPLPVWLADSGGKGIQLIPVAHGEAQLRTRWGKDGAQVVLDTCGVKVWLPGITDTATLKMASELCGQAAFTERIRFRSRDGDREEQRRVWHDVMTPDMIRQLPAGHALVIRGSLSPVVARLAVAWKDRAYKAARRAGTATAHLPRPRRACPPPARRLRLPGGWSPCPTLTPKRAATRPATPRPTRGADVDDRDTNRARRPDRRAAPARRHHPEAVRPGPPAGHRHPGGRRAHRCADPGRGRRGGHGGRPRPRPSPPSGI